MMRFAFFPLDDSYERYFSYILNNEDISECSEIFLNELRAFEPFL